MKTKAYTSLMILGLFIASAVAPVYAQFSGTLVVDVPFSFAIGDKAMPAGQYTLKPVGNPGLRSKLLIRSKDGRTAAIISTNLIQANAVQSEARLTFAKYGDQRFLAQIWMTQTEYGRQLPRSDVEADLVTKGVQKETVALVVRPR
jgi:hypothetical protein